MNEPAILAAALGCPHCPSRRECACPDGPEKCLDNPNCPCDPTVCPCKRPRRLPDPPGCLTRPLALSLGGAAVAGLLALIGVLVFGGDDEPDEGLRPGAPAAVSTTSLAPGATTTSAALRPPPTAPPLGPDVADDVDRVFGGKGLFTPDYCTPVPPGLRQIDQTGGSPLSDPSLEISAYCLRRVTLDGTQVPMFVGDYLLVAAVHEAPLDPSTNIRYQPGIGFDFSAIPNAVPKPDGEGILQVPADTVGFGGNLTGWEEAMFYSLPDFGDTDLHGYAFSEAASAVTAFAMPSDLVPYDSWLVLQSFGRQTEPAAIPVNADPSASVLVQVGAAPCLGDCMVESGRFQVDVEWPSAPGDVTAGAEGGNGAFWFLGPDDIELLVKVLNGCGPGSDSYWVFAGGLAGVRATITITDSSTGAVKSYNEPLGTSFAPILDTSAFATCP